MQTVRILDRTTPPHIVTLVIIAGLSALNMNIFLPSLPGIAKDFNADYAVVQLAVSGYLAMSALLQIIIGPLSDRYGRRPVLMASLIFFLAATLLSWLATSIELFLFGRMLQASVVAGIVLSRAIVRDMVDMTEAASMIGYVTMGMTLVPMVGPALGGFLDELFGWRSTLLVTFGFGVITAWLVFQDLGETNTTPSSSFTRQFRAYPELIRSRRFWGYTLTATFASGAFFSFLGGAPFVASDILGLSPSDLGLYFILIALGYMSGNFLSGRYTARIGVNMMMISGGVISTSGLALSILLVLAGQFTAMAFFAPMFLVGLGNGVTLPSANAGIVSVRPHLAGSASGLGGAMMIGGGAALSVLAGSILSVETGPYPLLAVMLMSAMASIASALYVVRIERKIALAAVTVETRMVE